MDLLQKEGWLSKRFRHSRLLWRYRYATEIMRAASDLIRNLQNYSTLLKILKYAAKISIKSLDINLNLWNNTLNVCISWAKLADINPYNMLNNFWSLIGYLWINSHYL